jgi:curli biogenesis system outer membrane secretion channel CsgG
MLRRWYRWLPVTVMGIGFLCAFATPTPATEKVVAVWDLENLNPDVPMDAAVGELLAAVVIETISASGKFSVVERERLLLALEELNLGSTGLVSEDSRLRIGKILGARWMVFGSYFVFQETMCLDLRLVEVETGRIVKAAQRISTSPDINEWLKAAQEAALQLL